MNIALFGYGKMGKTIEKFALQRGHKIVFKTDGKQVLKNESHIDVAIDFSVPEAAYKNITTCFKNHIPVVSGTTGWLKDYEKAVADCKKHNSAFIYASNFSLGVNLFFELNQKLTKLMKPFEDYKVTIEETHHLQKIDAPSGTAISLANQIIQNSAYTGWKLEKATENEIPITAHRKENIPGTHLVAYSSKIDDIEIKHTAHSRDGFALGAIIAAEWLKDKTGVFEMKDVLLGAEN